MYLFDIPLVSMLKRKKNKKRFGRGDNFNTVNNPDKTLGFVFTNHALALYQTTKSKTGPNSKHLQTT